MSSSRESAKLVVKDGWIICPVCNQNRRTIRITADTEAHHLPVYCRKCGTELILNISRGLSVERLSP